MLGLKFGDWLMIKLVIFGFDWEKFDNVVGGGLMFLRGGDIVVDVDSEGFGKDFSEIWYFCIVIGWIVDGDFFFVMIDGWVKISVGVIFEEEV